jgi:hypothetical protein
MMIRLTFRFAVGVVLLVACSMIRADWMADLGLDWWNAADYQRQVDTCVRRQAALEVADRLILDRIALKEEVMADLLSDRLTLLETAAWFRRLDRADGGPIWGPRSFPGNTEDERYCRQVLSWVKIQTTSWAPSQREMLQCRLEEELQDHLASHDGRVELPDLDGREPRLIGSE